VRLPQDDVCSHPLLLLLLLSFRPCTPPEQVMRSRSEKLAHIQQQVEAEVHSSATFAPRINPRSSMLAEMRRSRSCSRAPRSAGVGAGGSGDRSLSPPGARQEQADASREGRDVSRGRSRERAEGGRRWRTW
jgi:hypothetical protein